jgi:hypothetical protein
LHLLHGQVLAAQGALDEALEELQRELPQEDEGPLARLNHINFRTVSQP